MRATSLTLVREPSHSVGPLERMFLLSLCVLAGLRYIVAADLSAAAILAVMLCVVWLPILGRYRFVVWLAVTAAIAVLSGIALTAVNSTDHSIVSSATQSRSVMLVSLVATLGLLLWARSRIGDNAVPIAFGVGMVLAIALDPPSGGNIWRFSLSVPLTILILAITGSMRRWWLDATALVSLALIGLANDSRSNSSMLLLAAVIIVWQRLRRSSTRGRRRTSGLLSAALAAVAVFFLIQSAILDGYFGEITQLRTQAQIDRGGSIFAGGRPEAAASWALISMHPFGLGSGIRATSEEIARAKDAMLGIGYDPNNGYVQRYLFGSGIEVHSMLGDMWIWFGLAGVAVAAVMVLVVLSGVDRGLRTSTITGLGCYLAIRFVWDMFFSPAGSSMQLTALCLAILAVPLARAHSAERRIPTTINAPRI